MCAKKWGFKKEEREPIKRIKTKRLKAREQK